MTNDRDLFNKIDELFEDISNDQASNLVDHAIEPTREDNEKELIEAIEGNEALLSEEIIQNISEDIKSGGDSDRRVVDYLRGKLGLSYQEDPEEAFKRKVIRESVQNTVNQVDVVGPEDYIQEEVEVVGPEDYQQKTYIDGYADQMGEVIKSTEVTNEVVNEQLLHEKVKAIESQLGMLRQSIMEGTLVSGIGQGGDGQLPGSGG